MVLGILARPEAGGIEIKEELQRPEKISLPSESLTLALLGGLMKSHQHIKDLVTNLLLEDTPMEEIERQIRNGSAKAF